jgi:hypothetical protein
VLRAGGFASECDAKRYGDRLRSILQLASLSSRLGVDVGDDKPTSWVSEEFARASGFIKDHERIAPNVHGLAIFPDDDNTRVPIVDIQAKVSADPRHLISALEELGASNTCLGIADEPIRILNLALMTREPLAQMVLAFSVIEELGQNKKKWSEAQRNIKEELARAAESSIQGTREERAELAEAVRSGLYPLSLRQGVKQLLTRLGMTQAWKEWERLYSIRSGHFHGTNRLSDTEINQAAVEAVTLCGQILFALVSEEGGRIPTVTAKHFSNAIYALPQVRSP